MPTEVPPRRAIPLEHTWATESIFPSDDAWEAAFQTLAHEIEGLARFRAHLADSPAMLADWFEALQTMIRALGKIVIYANNYHNVDTTDQAAAAKSDRAFALYAQAQAAVSFAEPEILAIGLDTVRGWCETEPRLVLYAHYFDALEQRQKHVRSPEVEELLGYVQDPFTTAGATHGILADADLAFRPARPSDLATPPIPIAQGNIDVLLADPDRAVRCSAFENYADAHLALKNTMANCIAAGVKQNVFMASARHYDSALEAAVTANFIPVAVFRNVVETFRRNLPTWQRYWRVRKKALGVDKLYPYDLTAPLATQQPVVPFAQAVDWICEGLAPLGEEYVRTMRQGVLHERWVDVYPNQGKRAGAFSSGAPGTRPFVLMSYTDNLWSVSTLAHELGHSMHSYYTWATQPVIYADYSIFVAEVPSNLNQVLVREHLFAVNPARDFQIALIEELMSNFRRYFFIMPTLARFELECHERIERGQALTADDLITLLNDLFTEGYGGEVEPDRERVGITWAEFATHLYSNFYVYQYATGISAAHALAAGIRAGTPGAAEHYLQFLKAGNALYPLDALKLAGVDLTSPEPIERAFAYLTTIIDRLEALAS